MWKKTFKITCPQSHWWFEKHFCFYKQNKKKMNIAEYVAELGKLTERCQLGESLNDAWRCSIVCCMQKEGIQKCLFTGAFYTLKWSLEFHI